MGLRSDVETERNVVGYRQGYKNCEATERFQTIMANDCLNGLSSVKINFYSNPELLYAGQPMGVVGSSEAYRYLNENK